ncbi:MAG: glycosyltransferase family 2 protein, partial [Promethearchaeota archaeon]
MKAQTYKNFQCIILDDISTDNSVEVIKNEIEGDDRFKLIINTEKAFALKNIYDGINISNPKTEDIILTLDGDDWLASRDALEKVNDVYNSSKCWITFGSYAEYPNNRRGKFAKQIPKNIIETNSFRSFEWCSSHLRTFKYHLWERIKKEDLLDKDGNFYKMTWDLAFMFPMLEMAGNRSKYIKDILYTYNVDNPLNDHKIDNSYQVSLEREIRSKPKYDRIKTCVNLISAKDLMTPQRFDIAAKTLYARSLLKKTNVEFIKKLYLKHLEVWNGFEEKSPPKKGPEDFLSSFKALFKDIKETHFDAARGTIPVINKSPINGAHRVASCVILDKLVTTHEAHISEGQAVSDFSYFKNKRNFVKTGLDEKFLDEMALEFCRNKNNLYTITLFPSHDIPLRELENVIRENSKIIYKKEAILTNLGKLNYIHNLYYGESWIGTPTNHYAGIQEKSRLCFAKGSDICVLLLESNDINKMIKLKEKLRIKCSTGKHSVHINDTQEETWRIATSVFNENSLHFLNHKKFVVLSQFDKLFKKYSEIIKNRPDKE